MHQAALGRARRSSRPTPDIQILRMTMGWDPCHPTGRRLTQRRGNPISSITTQVSSKQSDSPLSGVLHTEGRYIAGYSHVCNTQIPGEYRINCISLLILSISQGAPFTKCRNGCDAWCSVTGFFDTNTNNISV